MNTSWRRWFASYRTSPTAPNAVQSFQARNRDLSQQQPTKILPRLLALAFVALLGCRWPFERRVVRRLNQQLRGQRAPAVGHAFDKNDAGEAGASIRRLASHGRTRPKTVS